MGIRALPSRERFLTFMASHVVTRVLPRRTCDLAQRVVVSAVLKVLEIVVLDVLEIVESPRPRVFAAY